MEASESIGEGRKHKMPTTNDQSIINELSNVTIPDLLFHYTTSAGLVGIIETGKIWITKIRYLNDNSELSLACDYIRNEIDLQKKGIGQTRTKEELDIMCRSLDDIEGVNVGVASFTEMGDQLSQWRGYCEIGNGYSLGFNGKTLREKLHDQYDYRLFPCIYQPEEHRRLAKELVDHHPTKDLLDITRSQTPASVGDQTVFDLAFSYSILFFAPLTKSESFKEEKEWRLISPVLSYTDANFRQGRHSLIPYWEFDLDLENALDYLTLSKSGR